MFLLKSPHRGDSNENTKYTIFNIKRKISLNYPKSASMGFFSKGLKNELETAVVNESSVFEPLKVFLISFYERKHIVPQNLPSQNDPCIKPNDVDTEQKKKSKQLGISIMGHLVTTPTFAHTVNSRYLEVEGTLSNTSRYPYFDISDVQN